MPEIEEEEVEERERAEKKVERSREGDEEEGREKGVGGEDEEGDVEEEEEMEGTGETFTDFEITPKASEERNVTDFSTPCFTPLLSDLSIVGEAIRLDMDSESCV